MNIGFIGAGTVGTALALTLAGRGYRVVAVASRTPESAQRLAAQLEGCEALATPQAVAEASDLVFITTPDGAIGPVAAAVRWRPGQFVAHCSGADSLDVLEPVRAQGAQTGAFHPLQSFASPTQAVENLPGSFFALEGEGALLEVLKQMAQAVGGRYVLLRPGDKVLYHTAAVFASNYTVALMGMATELWLSFGVSREEATKALLPLLQGTVKNIATLGLPHCLTGPIARGDSGTVQKHLSALAGAAPDLVPAYRELGLRTIPVALAKGRIDQEQAEDMQALLEGFRN
ncbi:MAG TPA: DUF2520 domain-containing protein [Dehalococcoidia bacterium]|nr:DUF2520 domain-containing protein [Dehalococcoidia bacterium]